MSSTSRAIVLTDAGGALGAHAFAAEPNIDLVRSDVSDRAQVEAVVARAVDAFGRLDVWAATPASWCRTVASTTRRSRTGIGRIG